MKLGGVAVYLLLTTKPTHVQPKSLVKTYSIIYKHTDCPFVVTNS